MLPDIKFSLPIIFILWCVAAVFAFHSWVMLAYPAMWAIIGILFFVLDRATAGGESAGSGE